MFKSTVGMRVGRREVKNRKRKKSTGELSPSAVIEVGERPLP